MNNNKIILIMTVLVLVLIHVIFFTISAKSYPSIEEQADLLNECGYELDYEAIEDFAKAWDKYIEDLEYYEDRRYEDRF